MNLKKKKKKKRTALLTGKFPSLQSNISLYIGGMTGVTTQHNGARIKIEDRVPFREKQISKTKKLCKNKIMEMQIRNCSHNNLILKII